MAVAKLRIDACDMETTTSRVTPLREPDLERVPQPPANTDAEQALLGAILINNHAFYRVIGTIDTEDFFKDAHRTIFATMRRMAEQSREIESLTRSSCLPKR